ncbi:MAG: hypothetical protein KKG47_09255 [Proteobacteria bacterium]|nr:hypothetical protein [Pseudomonadota bacterium]MBU1737149.1 hypothetical protein [Pseudomonadota bacterium]
MNKYLIITALYLVIGGCAALTLERGDVVDRKEIAGTYNLVLVGGTYAADAERLVILDAANDGYTFRPVTAPGRVQLVPEIGAAEALRKAEAFFSDHCAYDGYQIKKLTKPDGGFVGYELVPDYPASLCEDGNILQVSYSQGNEGEIKVYTWLILKKEHGGSVHESRVVREE